MFRVKHDKSSSRVKTEGTSWSKGSQQSWEGQRKNGSPEKIGRDGECHTDLSVREGKGLCRVGEWHRALTGRVEDIEQEDKEGNQTDVSGAR